MRFLTVNLGTMTGKSREVANMLKRKRVSIACVQETKWKGAKAQKNVEGYKMYYVGTSNNTNDVAVILEREWHDKILKVDRISDRIINVKLAYGNSMLNVISDLYTRSRMPTRREESILWTSGTNNEEYQTRSGNHYRSRPKWSCGKRQEWLRTRTRRPQFRRQKWRRGWCPQVHSSI